MFDEDEKYVEDSLFNAASALRSAAPGSSTLDEVNASLATFSKGYQALTLTRDSTHLWFRARKCEDRNGYSNARELIYREGGSPRYGRASQPGEAILYAGLNRLTALDECRAQKGDVFQLIGMRVREPYQFPCHVLGELRSLFVSGGSILNSRATWNGFAYRQLLGNGPDSTLESRRRFRADLFVDGFMGEVFRRHTGNEETDYFVSSQFAGHVLRHGGLIFPSVQTLRSANLAITKEHFDHVFEVMMAETVEITDRAGEGLYSLKCLNRTFTIEPDGEFNWSSAYVPPGGIGSHGGIEIHPAVRGWQVIPTEFRNPS